LFVVKKCQKKTILVSKLKLIITDTTDKLLFKHILFINTKNNYDISKAKIYYLTFIPFLACRSHDANQPTDWLCRFFCIATGHRE